MLNRRSFNKLLLGATALSFAACNSLSGSNGALLPANKKRVVIVGGGFGGAAAAKYLRKFDSQIEIVLIEEKKEYYTCPFSNAVIAGMEKIDFIKHDLKELSRKHNINVVYAKVKKVDGATNSVILESGQVITYSKAIVSPGIDFKYEKGYTAENSKFSPHAVQAGEQTVLLQKQLENMLTYFIPSGFAYSVISFERYFVFAIPIEIGSFNSSNIFFFKYKANSSISDSSIYPVTSAKNSSIENCSNNGTSFASKSLSLIDKS